MLSQIEKIYKNDKHDPAKKVMLFTSEVCLPEIMKHQAQEKSDGENVFLSIENSKDQDIVPFMCFYNGLSFLRRLPTQDEISDENKAIDLESGFREKESFVQVQKENGSDKDKCKTDL